MIISYAILTHNQGSKLQQLLKNLTDHIDIEDQIVIVDDYSDDPQTIAVLKKYVKLVHIRYRQLNNNFSSQKNFLFDLCKGDYIFNLDADQNINPQLIKDIKAVLRQNSQIQLYYVPRINIVQGITQQHIHK